MDIYIYMFFFFKSMHVYSIYMVRNICLTISNLKFHHMINMIIYIYIILVVKYGELGIGNRGFPMYINFKPGIAP